MNTIYKILFEVKLLHEYYLTGTKGDNIFAGANQQQRINFLLRQFQKGSETINRDLEFLIPDSLLQLFKDYYLKAIPSYSGFKCAVKCRTEVLADGTIVYKPFVTIPDNLDLMILLHQKKTIRSYSNISFKNHFSSLFFFSNDDLLSVKQPPFLSATVPVKDNSRVYEQGDIALFPTNKVNVFLNNGATPPWLELPGTGYVNESDSMLVPLVFSYSFPIGDNITHASFSLKDASATEVKKINAASSKPLRSVVLNFRMNDNSVISLPSNSPRAASIYTLNVTASNGYSKSHTLLFAGDEINLSGAAGLISIKPKVANPLLSLTDGSGFLFTRVLPGGVKLPAPIFELWMKSRLVFWKYSNNKQRKIKTTADTQDVLTDVDDDGDGIADGTLITKNPFPITNTLQLIKKTDGTFQHLPNPLQEAPIAIKGTKNFVNIMVPESTMFPLI